MATNINIDASSKQNYLGQDVNDAITNSDNPSAINPFLTASQIVGGLPTGAIPSNYVTRMSSLEISSPTFIDVPSLSTTVTVTAAVKAYCLFSFEASATGADAQIEFKVVVNGETSDIVMVDFAKASNSNGSINFRTTNNLTIGSHVVKVQARKVGGNKIASLDKGFLFTFALQAPKGETGAGVPIGGTTNQVLSKIDGSDYNTQWVTPASGSSSLDIGTTPIINGTIGRIPFQGAGNVLQQDSGLFWDNVNKRFGVNQPIPTARFHVKAADATSTVVARVENSAGTSDIFRVQGDGWCRMGSDTEFLRFDTTNKRIEAFKAGGYGTSIILNDREVKFNDFGNTGNDFLRVSVASGIAVNRVSSGGINGLTFSPLTFVSNHFGISTTVAAFDFTVYRTSGSNTNLSKIKVFNGDNGNIHLLSEGGGGVGIGLGSGVHPTAKLHLQAGTATAGTSPIKLTAGTNMTTPENGAFEFDGTNLYFTVGGVRKTVTLV